MLGHKYILAYILINTAPEFKGMSPKEVVPYIEGEPKIGVVPIDPGQTNKAEETGGQKVVGFNSEDSEINEGLIRFDIVFYVRIPSQDGLQDGLTQIIINVEAQKKNKRLRSRHLFFFAQITSKQSAKQTKERVSASLRV